MSYSSALGRWVQQDPAGYIDGANRYNVVSSNPVHRLDPSGLDDNSLGGHSPSDDGESPSDDGINTNAQVYGGILAWVHAVGTLDYKTALAIQTGAGRVGPIDVVYGRSVREWAEQFGVTARGWCPERATEMENAARHLAWQAELTRRYGGNAAATVGDLHEINPFDPLDSATDQANNKAGRAIGSRASSIQEVERMVEEEIRERCGCD